MIDEVGEWLNYQKLVVVKEREYQQLLAKAKGYEQGLGDGSLRYDNSAHINTIQSKFRACLRIAEELKDQEKIDAMEAIINDYSRA